MSVVPSSQNFFIAASVEKAEKALAILMKHDIAVAALDIGRYSSPVIKVHYSENCKKISGHGFCQNPDSKRGVMITRAALEECLVLWEEPMNPAITLLNSVALH